MLAREGYTVQIKLPIRFIVGSKFFYCGNLSHATFQKEALNTIANEPTKQKNDGIKNISIFKNYLQLRNG